MHLTIVHRMYYELTNNCSWILLINNATNSGTRKWKHMFDHQGWAQNLPETKEKSQKSLFFNEHKAHKLCYTLGYCQILSNDLFLCIVSCIVSTRSSIKNNRDICNFF